MASRLVQYGVPSRPGTGGTRGRVPVAGTTPRRASNVRSPTVTRRGPARRPLPRTSRAPFAAKPSAATWSFQSSVASSRIRSATLVQSGVTTTSPARAGTRPPRRAGSRPGSSSCWAHMPSTDTHLRRVPPRPPPRPVPLRPACGDVLAARPQPDDHHIHLLVHAHASPRSAGSPGMDCPADARAAGQRPVPGGARVLARERTPGDKHPAQCADGHHRMRCRSTRPPTGHLASSR